MVDDVIILEDDHHEEMKAFNRIWRDVTSRRWTEAEQAHYRLRTSRKAVLDALEDMDLEAFMRGLVVLLDVGGLNKVIFDGMTVLELVWSRIDRPGMFHFFEECVEAGCDPSGMEVDEEMSKWLKESYARVSAAEKVRQESAKRWMADQATHMAVPSWGPGCDVLEAGDSSLRRVQGAWGSSKT